MEESLQVRRLTGGDWRHHDGAGIPTVTGYYHATLPTQSWSTQLLKTSNNENTIHTAVDEIVNL